jgi:hypothetical protein
MTTLITESNHEYNDYIWETFSAENLANIAHIHAFHVKEWLRENRDNYNECERLSIDDVRKFLVWKGIVSCIREYNEEMWIDRRINNISPPPILRQVNIRVRT